MFWRIIITILGELVLTSCCMYKSNYKGTFQKVVSFILWLLLIALSILAIIGAWVI